MKQALFIIPKHFNGHELWVTLETFNARGISYTVLSQDKVAIEEPKAFTKGGFRIYTHGIVYDFHPDDLSKYDAMLFVSGDLGDLEQYWESPHIEALLKKGEELDLIMGAVCVSTLTLRPILKGKHTTGYESIRCKDKLEAVGAIYVPLSVVIDGKIVTGENTLATQKWAEAIVCLMMGEVPDLGISRTVGNITHRRRKARRDIPELEKLKKGSE